MIFTPVVLSLCTLISSNKNSHWLKDVVVSSKREVELMTQDIPGSLCSYDSMELHASVNAHQLYQLSHDVLTHGCPLPWPVSSNIVTTTLREELTHLLQNECLCSHHPLAASPEEAANTQTMDDTYSSVIGNPYIFLYTQAPICWGGSEEERLFAHH